MTLAYHSAPRSKAEKERIEDILIDAGLLSPWYTRSCDSKGRGRPEPKKDPLRTDFQRDRDRIVHSHAFRRLREKTQVFLLPDNPLLATRLTHSMDVNQIARSIADDLRLNQTLVEAIALGHDVGHVPFGHSGEAELTDIMRELLGDPDYVFHHAVYGAYVLEHLENGGRGKNLTYEVLDGILMHSLGRKSLMGALNRASTPEGVVVMYSDKIAYTFRDLDDALRVGIIRESDVPSEIKLFGPNYARWIGSAISAVVQSSLESMKDPDTVSPVAFYGETFEAFERIRSFMYSRVYGQGIMEEEFLKARGVIRQCFYHVMETRFSALDQQDAAKQALDVIACMTDTSLLSYYREHFVPRGLY